MCPSFFGALRTAADGADACVDNARSDKISPAAACSRSTSSSHSRARAHRAHRDERHGGADWIGERLLDTELVPVTREAFRDADDLPSDEDVFRVFAEPLQLLGEGYHVIALVEPRHRFVAKPRSTRARPAAGGAEAGLSGGVAVRPRCAGRRIAAPGHLAAHPRVRSVRSAGRAQPTYIADDTLVSLADDERRALERFRAIGIVRSLGMPRLVSIDYPDDFPQEKRASGGLRLSVVIVQQFATPLATAIERALRAGDAGAARDLEARYRDFTQQLWQCGVSHLDFSMLNIGITGEGRTNICRSSIRTWV